MADVAEVFLFAIIPYPNAQIAAKLAVNNFNMSFLELKLEEFLWNLEKGVLLA
jgi:hypothetical protein